MARERYRIEIEEGPGNFSGYSPDIPGCVATGKTREETEGNLRAALELHIKGLLEDGLPVPPGYGRLACLRCGKVFKPRSSRAVFCSSNCQKRAWEKVPPPKEVPRRRACAGCGASFRPAKAHALYCSVACRRRAAYHRMRKAS